MTSDEKRAMLKQQVDSKVYWGASEHEVMECLNEKHGLQPDDAKVLYAGALRAKSTQVRKRAGAMLVFSGIGLVAFLGYLAAQWFGNFVIIGWPVVVVFAVGILSAVTFIRSIIQLVSGQRLEPMT